MEIDVIDAAIVAGQSVQHPPAGRVPNVDEPIRRAGRHFGAIRRPTASQQIPLKVVLMTAEDLDATLDRSIGSDVPDPECIVHGIGQDVRTVWGQGNTSHGVRMAFKNVEQFVLSQIPHFDVVVQSTGDHRFRRVVVANGRHLISVVEGIDGVALTFVPDLDGIIVATGNNHLLATSSAAAGIHEARVTLQLADAL